MKLPDPGTYVRVYYVKEKPGRVIGEEGEIVGISSDHVSLKFQPPRRKDETEDPQPIKSSIPKHEIKEIVKVNR